MKSKLIILGMILLMIFKSCASKDAPEPEQCSMCDDLSRHAPCIINLSTGEKLELEIYEPHPFLAGEIAEEQLGGYFSLIRGIGIEAYTVGAEFTVVTIPVKSDKLDQTYFCNSCRELLANERKNGYVLADLKDPKEPIVYPIVVGTSFSIRRYTVEIQEQSEEKYILTIAGHYEVSGKQF